MEESFGHCSTALHFFPFFVGFIKKDERYTDKDGQDILSLFFGGIWKNEWAKKIYGECEAYIYGQITI